MAETRQPVNDNALDISGNRKDFRTNNEFRTFTNFDMFCVFFSMGTFVADLTTDIILVAEYWRKEHFYWSLGTFLLILVPAILIQLFSMRWHLMDEAVSLWHWISHVFLVGVIHRYTVVLKTGFEARESKSAHDVQRLFLQQSDICMLHLFESFLEAAPQLILQLYIMVVMRDWHFFTGLSAIASLCSLSWAVVSYVRALRRTRAVTCNGVCHTSRPLSLALQATWRGAMLAARLAALLMFAVAFQHWIFTLLGVHWLVMTMWVIQQKTDFCPSRLEEVFYNCVVGVIYCFCFFNLREGQARYRMIAFYAIMVSQNVICLLLFLYLSPGAMKQELVIITSVIIISGTFLGLSSMLIYYRWLHPAGPIKWWCDVKEQSPNPDPKSSDRHNATSEGCSNQLANVSLRSLKSAWQDTSENALKCEESPRCTENSPQSDTECTDKKLLLDHWIARAGSPTFASAPIDNVDTADVTGIEFYSVANTPEQSSRNHPDKIGILNTSFQFEHEASNRMKADISGESSNPCNKNKRRGICSPTELGGNFSKMDQDPSLEDISEGNESIDVTAQKRRGICSSGQLKDDNLKSHCAQDELIENLRSVSEGSEDLDHSNQKTSSDSLNLDLDLSFSDINSSDINEFNENIVQKLCLSTLKNIKNVHQDADIRNIQKIALEILKDLYSKGGVKDDQDLESELSSSVGRDLETPSEVLSAHDYENICAVNIAREAWGLRSWRGCSDMGGSPPPPPPPLRRPAPPPPHHNYIRTVAYELAKCEDSNCQLMKTPEYHKEPESSVFIAKPYVVDQNDVIFPLSTPLEPILEELDEIIDNSGTIRRRQRHNSESALVATIDEIRNDTITDSPRNVYHRAVWDSPCPNFENEKNYIDSLRKATMNNLKKVLWKEEFQNDGCGEQSWHSVKIDYVNGVQDCRKSCNMVTSDNPLRVCVKNENKSPKKVSEFKLKSDCDVDNKHFSNIADRQKVGKSGNNKKNNSGSRVHFQKKDAYRQSPKVKIVRDDSVSKSPVGQLHHSYEEVTFVPQLVKDTSKGKCNNSTDDVSNLGISSSLQSLIDRDCQNNIAVPKTTTESRPNSRRNNGNRPRRKFSLLREKFEPKSKHSDEEMLFQSLESVRSLSHEVDVTSSPSCFKNNANILLLNQESKIKFDKENLTPLSGAAGRAEQMHEEVVLSLTPCDNPLRNELTTTNLMEKRSIFLKQVLSPPKMNSWNKKNLNEFVN